MLSASPASPLGMLMPPMTLKCGNCAFAGIAPKVSAASAIIPSLPYFMLISLGVGKGEGRMNSTYQLDSRSAANRHVAGRGRRVTGARVETYFLQTDESPESP